MSDYVLVDTDVASFIFKGHSFADSYRGILEGRILALSFMGVAELYQWTFRHDWGARRLQSLKHDVSRYLVIESSEAVNERWGLVCAECSAAGRPISAQDAWHAAVALEYEIPFATNNVRDYETIEGLEIWTV